MINLTALCLKKRDALLSVLLYIFMGIIGLPVFSGGTAGLSKLLSPVGGYYFSFAVAVFLMSRFKGRTPDLKKYLTVTLFIGIPVEHIFAVGFMCIISKTDLWAAFTAVSLPFIVGDIIKAFASSVIAVPLNKALRANRY